MAPKPGRVFFPKFLDISSDESALFLRQLELEAYAGIISALRSQGDLTKEKKTLLTEVCACLGINEDRHRAEIRRAVNDEKLCTIALHNSGSDSDTEWIREGRRMVPLPRRPLQITAYMEEADRVAEMIAKENASLPQPEEVEWTHFVKKKHEVTKPVGKPEEANVKTRTRKDSLYCAKCLSNQNDVVDASTTTDDLFPDLVSEGPEDASDVPSVSDSFVFLPSGTTVKVSSGKSDKEEHDAYSLKTNFAGNFDFENAPEINLTGSRSNKRKRKKSTGSAQTREESLTIRQVIKPNEIIVDEVSGQAENYDKEMTSKPSSEGSSKESAVRPEPKKRRTEDRSFQSEQQMSRGKRKKQVSQAVTVQHTPVPPEHLYAVGVTKPERRQTAPPYAVVDKSYEKSDYSAMKVEQSPTKQLGFYSSRISPLSPSYCPGIGVSPATSTAIRELASSSESSLESYSRGFRYSPTKPFYRPPNIGQTVYSRSSKSGHSKRHKSSPSAFSFTKKAHQSDSEHQSIVKRISGKNEEQPMSTVKTTTDDIQLQHKAYRPTFPPPGLFHPSNSHPSNTFVLPTLETEQAGNNPPAPPPMPISHSSSLEEFASVSLMASALNTSTMVETGLAPVSAIVSRVTSPAPGQISSASMAERSTTPIVMSKSQNEEGAQPTQWAKVVQASTIRERSAFTVKQETAFASATKLKVPSQHPLTHQVRLASTAADNVGASNVPITFASVLPHGLSSSSQVPRMISTNVGKAHTLLKSSSGNVITVTANTLPGMKSSVSTIVSGASIVKPPVGQKTSIIVVHKAPGAKGKAVSTSFPTLGVEGSKVITVTTKNIVGPPSGLPRAPVDSMEEGTSESALGSIQGLVSGLPPTGIVKKAKVVGMKPKFITMPIHKKPFLNKPGEAAKARIIPNVIRAPGKVLVKASGSTLTTAQLRTIPSSHIVKPIFAPPSATVTTHDQHDIVAAALSQSLGSSAVRPTHDAGTLSSHENASGIKVTTSTPAASTIKAFAATLQKNSSTGQQKQNAPASVTTLSLSVRDKNKVMLSTSRSQSQPTHFTPNQPQVHRSPQSSSVQRSKPVVLPVGSPLSGPTPFSPSVIGNVTKSFKGSPATSQQHGPQHPIMQVKVLSQASTSSQILSKPLPQVHTDVITHSTVSKDGSARLQSPSTAISSGDRATFIYQYHPTPKLGTKAGPVLPSGTLPGDVITLHTINSEMPVAETEAEVIDEANPKPAGGNLVKISLSSISALSPSGEPTSVMSSATTLPVFARQYESAKPNATFPKNDERAAVVTDQEEISHSSKEHTVEFEKGV